METVAERAGVARMTVYHQFGSRAGLLEGLADHLAERGGMTRLREAFMAPDPETAVRTFVHVFVGFSASDRVTMRRLRAMAVAFPSQDRGPRERDRWRKGAAANLVARFGKTGRVRSGLSSDALADLVCALTSFEAFDALATGDRSPDAVAEVLSESVLRLLGPRPHGLPEPSTSLRFPTAPPRRPRPRARA